MILSTLTKSILNRAATKALFFVFCMLFLMNSHSQAEDSKPAQNNNNVTVQTPQAVAPKKVEAGTPAQPIAKSAEKTPSFLILCKNLKMVRTIRVSKGKEIYSTVYTKNGKDQVIGQTRMFNSGKNIAISVKDNLVSSGWTCREVSDSQLTISETN